MTEISQLIAPTELTTGLALLLAVLFVLFGYLGVRMRHAAVIFMWSLMLIVLILVILINLPFIWFWVAVLVSAFVTLIAGLWRYLVEPAVSNG